MYSCRHKVTVYQNVFVQITGRSDGHYEAEESSVKPQPAEQREALHLPGRVEGDGGRLVTFISRLWRVISGLNDCTCPVSLLSTRGKGV